MDEQLYLMAVGLSLDEKVEKAIEYYRTFEHEALKRDPVNGYYLCDSYGKDSCVILDLAKRSGVKFQAHHNLTTLDDPALIIWGRKNHAETVVHKPAKPMLWRLANEKTTLPTRRGRWCCAEYKEHRGKDLVNVFGVRASESARRKAQWRVWQPMPSTNSYALNPILYWTDSDVWEYLKSGVPYPPMYDDPEVIRMGCIGCPMSSRRNQEFARHPKIKQAWQRALKRFWDRTHNQLNNHGKLRYWSKFKSPEDMWNWWMEENQPEAEDDCQMGLF